MRGYHYVALFLAGGFLAQLRPALRPGHFGPLVSHAVCVAAWTTRIVASGQRPVGQLQFDRGLRVVPRRRFNVARTRDAVIVGAGVIITGVMLANAFGQLYSK